MTKAKFKDIWESDEEGGGITYETIAACAKEWGLYEKPKCCRIDYVTYRVLVAAGVVDAELFLPEVDD